MIPVWGLPRSVVSRQLNGRPGWTGIGCHPAMYCVFSYLHATPHPASTQLARSWFVVVVAVACGLLKISLLPFLLLPPASFLPTSPFLLPTSTTCNTSGVTTLPTHSFCRLTKSSVYLLCNWVSSHRSLLPPLALFAWQRRQQQRGLPSPSTRRKTHLIRHLLHVLHCWLGSTKPQPHHEDFRSCVRPVGRRCSRRSHAHRRATSEQASRCHLCHSFWKW